MKATNENAVSILSSLILLFIAILICSALIVEISEQSEVAAGNLSIAGNDTLDGVPGGSTLIMIWPLLVIGVRPSSSFFIVLFSHCVIIATSEPMKSTYPKMVVIVDITCLAGPWSSPK